MINILFFGQLKERLGCATLQWPITKSLSVQQLKQQLIEQQCQWQEWLSDSQVLCAVNHTIVDHHASINVGDEVAFFPPVTGG